MRRNHKRAAEGEGRGTETGPTGSLGTPGVSTVKGSLGSEIIARVVLSQAEKSAISFWLSAIR